MLGQLYKEKTSNKVTYKTVEEKLIELYYSSLGSHKESLSTLYENVEKIKQNIKLYYDEEKASEIMRRYYQHLPFSSNGRRLFKVYHKLVKSTHVNKVPYFISKDLYLYTWVDLQPDGSIKSIYSGEKRKPEEILFSDFFVMNERYDRFRRILYSFSDDQEVLKKVKAIEKEFKFNTEHVVPQSWFGAKEPMKGDLHHLFVCTPECNRTRSNYPYGDHPFYTPESPHEKIRNNCGITYENVFEPEYGKGIVARAMFYFFIRYPNTIKRSYRNKIDLAVLRQWNREFPVTIYEKHRNLAIYQIQGNRNPFIDRPNLADKIIFPVERKKR